MSIKRKILELKADYILEQINHVLDDVLGNATDRKEIDIAFHNAIMIALAEIE